MGTKSTNELPVETADELFVDAEAVFDDEDPPEEPHTAGADVAQRERLASVEVERAALSLGLTVERILPNTVVCSNGGMRSLFVGFVGSSTGRVSADLCSNDAWLRSHLRASNLPVVRTRNVDLTSLSYAAECAEELGFPVVARLIHEHDTQSRIAGESSELQEWLRQLRTMTRDRKQRILIEESTTTRIDVAVVGTRVVAVSEEGRTGDGNEELTRTAEPLAIAALEALPGLLYASIGLVLNSAGGARSTPLLYTIDPGLHQWGGSPLGKTIAHAILQFEFGMENGLQDRVAQGDKLSKQ